MKFISTNLALIFFCGWVGPAFSQSNESFAKNTLEKFCTAEFEGVRDIRFHLTKMTHKRSVKLAKTDPELKGNLVFWDADSIGVVSTFSVVGILQKDNSMFVSVKYSLLLETKGEGDMSREFFKKCAKNHVVVYQLTKEKDGWMVLNPPIPYISIDALIKFYKNLLSTMPKDIDNGNKYTSIQRAYFTRHHKDLDYLNKVKGDSLFCNKTQ
jgi:hypothetical protein